MCSQFNINIIDLKKTFENSLFWVGVKLKTFPSFWQSGAWRGAVGATDATSGRYIYRVSTPTNHISLQKVKTYDYIKRCCPHMRSQTSRKLVSRKSTISSKPLRAKVPGSQPRPLRAN